MPKRSGKSEQKLLSPPSSNEGLILTATGAGGRRFLVRNGRRVWIDPPPPDTP